MGGELGLKRFPSRPYGKSRINVEETFMLGVQMVNVRLPYCG